jgi:hypothetical protein
MSQIHEVIGIFGMPHRRRGWDRVRGDRVRDLPLQRKRSKTHSASVCDLVLLNVDGLFGRRELS